MGLVGELTVVSILTLITYFVYQHMRLRKQFKDVPGPRSLPFLGHGTIVKPDPEGFMDQVMGMGALYPNEPRMVLLWLGPHPTLMVYSATLLEPILSSSKHLNKGFAYRLLEPWLGLSLLTSESEQWRPKRKLLTPTFHYDILKDFVPVFNEHSKILVQKLAAIPKGEVIEISSYVTLCALDIICETSMGKCVNAQVDENNKYVHAVTTINDCVQNRTKNPLMWNNFIFNTFGDGKVHEECLDILHSFTKKVITDREAELQQLGWRFDGRLAFLDLLLDMAHNEQMDRNDIQAEVDTFMFEGHDTTSTAITWALHLLGSDLTVQRKAQEEIDMIIDANGEIGVEALAHLKYLECCVKETLRLFPSVPAIMRELGSDQTIGGTVFPKGTHIILNQYLVHRDPAYWPNPEEFNPDRFMAETATKRHAFSFVPFSAGSRNCIGQRFAYMEMKTVLAWVLHYFTIESLERRCDVNPKMELILRPADGIHVKLSLRKEIPTTNE